MNRAYSILTIKSVDEDQRTFTGTATTPSPDRIGDVVEPLGVKFKNPMPLLLHHQSDMPVGSVKFDKPTKNGIDFTAKLPRPRISETLIARVDEAWESVKLGLIGGVSIGFRALETSRLDDGGLRFIESEVLELSLVTIPANAEATIQFVKSLDTQQRAATGQTLKRVVRLDPPGASGSTPKAPQEGKSMATIAEQITLLEGKLHAQVKRQEAAMQKGMDEARSADAAEYEEFDEAQAEIEACEANLVRLRKLEKTLALSAKPVIKSPSIASDGGDGSRSIISVKAPPKLEDGIGYARLVKVKMAAKLTGDSPLVMAQRMYGPDSEVVGIITKANEVVAGTTLSGNWAADLVSAEGAAVAAFLEYLRPATILGKFGAGGVPNMTRIDFFTPYVIETGAGDAYWVGEGKPKPLVAFDYDRSTLTPLKIANIAVLTEENIRYSTPNSDAIVRNALVKAIAAGLDVAFIDPTNAGTSNVKPASITNGAETVASTGDTADDIRMDVRALFQKFINANNAPQSGVFIMSATNALALSMATNPLGQREFPGISMMGGEFQGLPVIVSQHIGDVVAIVNASDVFLGDEGGVAVDMSREASIEMRSSGLGMDATAGTATASSVSMFQTNSVALRAERTINWKRARASAVAYLTSVGWGGAVPTA